MFGDTWTHLYDNGSVEMNTFNSIKTIFYYHQLSCFVQLLQNFLTLSILIMMLLQVRTENILIDLIFAVFVDCLPIVN